MTLSTVHQHLLKDKYFIVRGNFRPISVELLHALLCGLELASANVKYHNKLLAIEKDSKSLFALGWKVEELKQLVEKCQILLPQQTLYKTSPPIQLLTLNHLRGFHTFFAFPVFFIAGLVIM